MKKIKLGAVLASPIIPELWWEFCKWTKDNGLEIEMVYHNFYTDQVESFVNGEVDITWNGPFGFVLTDYLLKGQELIGPMRDTDLSTTTIFLAHRDSDISCINDIKGKKVSFAKFDSAESRIIPTAYLLKEGLEVGIDYEEILHNVDEEILYNTFVHSEIAAVKDVESKKCDVVPIFKNRFKRMVDNNQIDSTKLKVVGETTPFDHCIFTGHPKLDKDLFKLFNDLFLSMDPTTDERLRKGMDLENVNRWVEGRTDNYELLKKGAEYLKLFDII